MNDWRLLCGDDFAAVWGIRWIGHWIPWTLLVPRRVDLFRIPCGFGNCWIALSVSIAGLDSVVAVVVVVAEDEMDAPFLRVAVGCCQMMLRVDDWAVGLVDTLDQILELAAVVSAANAAQAASHAAAAP